jgi:hypothetical protein
MGDPAQPVRSDLRPCVRSSSRRFGSPDDLARSAARRSLAHLHRGPASFRNRSGHPRGTRRRAPTAPGHTLQLTPVRGCACAARRASSAGRRRWPTLLTRNELAAVAEPARRRDRRRRDRRSRPRGRQRSSAAPLPPCHAGAPLAPSTPLSVCSPPRDSSTVHPAVCPDPSSATTTLPPAPHTLSALGSHPTHSLERSRSHAGR